jgi:hypothetical protein
MGFKFFNKRDKEAKQLRDKNTHIKYQILASILQSQMPHTCLEDSPKDPANSPLRPASDAETQDTVQNLAILYAHQQGLVYNVDNGDTGR